MTTERGWSEMPLDIFYHIVNQKRLSLADIGRMATICKSWKAVLYGNNWFDFHVNENIGKMPFPWLMLAEYSSAYNDGKRGFFNPATRQVSKIYLPEAEGRRCCGSGYGWIVTMGKDMEINLLNPLTREQLNLPSQLTFTEFIDGSSNEYLHTSLSRNELVSTFIRKAILTCSPGTGECVVVAILGSALWDVQLASAKVGNSSTWTVIPPPPPISEVDVEDIVFHQGHLFGINFEGELHILDLSDHPEHGSWRVISAGLYRTCVRIFQNSGERLRFNYYLAIMGSDLVTLARGRKNCQQQIYRTKKFVVFKLHKGQWSQVDDIGDSCFFVGATQTFFLSPVPLGYRPNCIYFTDDTRIFNDSLRCRPRQLLGHDMALFSMDSGKVSSFYEGISLSKFSPPLWVTLNFN